MRDAKAQANAQTAVVDKTPSPTLLMGRASSSNRRVGHSPSIAGTEGARQPRSLSRPLVPLHHFLLVQLFSPVKGAIQFVIRAAD